ncbi:MAG: zinc-binding dehydrogenase [Candidatus Eisenbacteria bacterium]|uniref:Zinc-binding dehydrogenase n=1 Tax=Eiseniibacteriota bacterium TaxID=2212470 RepID=A0A849SGZ3_UNCEI|nr:zinc-binding dehydrogenase [Candidatus Eisenbacteria bacterium]
MKAAAFTRHGGPEVLELIELPEPRCGPDEVRLAVRACGLNHLDLWIRQGTLGLEIELPHVGGCDVVGEALEVGAAVTSVKTGDRVLAHAVISCGRCDACASGADHQCRHYDLIGRRRNGGFAEQCVIPARNALPCPSNLSWEEAATLPVVLVTAWHMLNGRARLRAGEDCLVIGASSGVGSAAVQVAKLLGARVIATAGSAAKLERARALGADDLIDHSRTDIAAEVRRLTAKKGVEVVFEHVGGKVFESCVASLARNGRLVTCGATIGSQVKLDINVLFGRHLSLLGSWMGSRGELAEVLEFVSSGRLKPVLDSVLPLSQLRAAHERLESGAHFGKLVLVP